MLTQCPWREGVLASFIVLGGMAIAGAADFELPALNSPASSEHHAGKMVWADLITPDLSTAEKFYGGVFGWTFKRIRAGSSDYSLAMFGGRPIGGVMQRTMPSAEPHQSAWLTFMACADVEATQRVAVEHGAKVLTDAKNYPQRGKQIVLSDPEGAVFAVLASSSGDSPDYLPVVGEWIWSSLHAQNAGNEAAFYQELFGFDVFEAPSADGAEHLILSSDNYARASANGHASESSRKHSHWLNFVRVENAAQTAAKVTAMGGHVLVRPRVDRHGGMLAVMSDPAGAPFGVMEWSESDIKAEPK